MNFLSTSLTKRATAGAIGSCFIPPQNGVVEGSMYYGSGNASPLMTRASSIDTQNGNVASSDTPSRPKILEVNSLSKNAPHRGFLTKNMLDDIGDNDDGSLPCTPELLEESGITSCSAEDEVLENDTRRLIDTFLREFTGLSKSRWGQGKTLSTMKMVVEDLLEKHRYAYNGRFVPGTCSWQDNLLFSMGHTYASYSNKIKCHIHIIPYVVVFLPSVQ